MYNHAPDGYVRAAFKLLRDVLILAEATLYLK